MAEANVRLRVDASQAVDQLKKTNAQTKKLEETVKKTNGQLRNAKGRFESTGKAAGTATGNIQRMGVAFRTTVGPIVAAYGALTFLNRSLQVASQRQVDVAKLTNGLQNLGATSSDFERLQVAADKFGNATLFDQEDATKAFALLTSFQRIGVESYERVTKAASDLATITGQDLRSAQIQLAKALEDPAKRVTDLARSGTVFTEQQKEQIKVLQESGRLLEAQNLILQEIEKQYGGSAEAAGSAGFAGALDSLGEATRDLQEQLGSTQSLIDGVTFAVNLLTEGVKGLQEGLKDIDTIMKAVGIVAEQAGLGTIEFAKGVDILRENLLNVFPQLRLFLFAFEQMTKLSGKVVDSQAGPRNFGMNYASQERSLFEAAGGFNPYKSTTPTPTPTPSPDKGVKGAKRGKTDLQRQQEAASKLLKTLQERRTLATALTDDERKMLQLKIDQANVEERFPLLSGETLQNVKDQLEALYAQENVTNSIKKLQEQRANASDQAAIKAKEDAIKLEELYKRVGSAIESGIVNGIMSAIDGTKTLQETLAEILKDVGSILLQFAIRTGLNAIDSNIFPMAEGGYVSGPTRALIGEGGEPEYVIPESKMRESMARYSRGARGSSVIPETGASGTSGEGGGTAVAAPIDVRYTVERINSVDYVTADQFQAGMQQAATQGAKKGEQQTLKRLQMSGSTRKRIGI